MILKNLAFSNSKIYCIYFNTSLYNTPNIKFYFFTTLFKYSFFILFFLLVPYVSFSLFLSVSLSFQAKTINKHTTHGHCQPPPLLANSKPPLLPLTTPQIETPNQNQITNPQATTTYPTQPQPPLNAQPRKTYQNGYPPPPQTETHHHKPKLITSTIKKKKKNSSLATTTTN